MKGLISYTISFCGWYTLCQLVDDWKQYTIVIVGGGLLIVAEWVRE